MLVLNEFVELLFLRAKVKCGIHLIIIIWIITPFVRIFGKIKFVFTEAKFLHNLLDLINGQAFF